MSRNRRALVFASVVILLSGGVAEAHTVAHPTSPTINRHPQGSVKRGTIVTFRGKLHSPTPACRSGSRIRLIKVGQGVVARTRTNFAGIYRFRRRVHQTSRWRVDFPGEILSAVHPHNHTCAASSSNSIRVLAT